MSYLNLRIGDRIPVEARRQPFGLPCAQRWFVMSCDRTRRGMVAASAWMTKAGAKECWFPQDERFQVRVVAGKKRREKYETPVVPGLVFVLTDLEPAFDVLLERKRIKPLMIAGMPVTVTEDVMAKMEAVPKRIADLRDAAEQARIAEMIANMPRAGDSVQFRAGPLSGRVVRVDSVDRDDGTAIVEIFGIGRTKADLTSLKKIA